MNKKFRKLLKFLMAFVMAFTIVGCNSNNDSEQYKEANKLVTQGKYKEAKKIYKEISDYKDSKNRVNDCNFLVSIQKSILNRMEESNKENHDNDQLVNTELGYLEKYKDTTFGDSKLKELSSKYLDGLNEQKASLKETAAYESEYQWQEGMVKRFEALKELYNDYGLCKNNNDFIGQYINKVEDEKSLLTAYKVIDDDIGSQMTDGDLNWQNEDGVFYCDLKNNTDYNFNITFYVYFTNTSDVVTESQTAEVYDIEAHSSYRISVPEPDLDEFGYRWETYIDDVNNV